MLQKVLCMSNPKDSIENLLYEIHRSEYFKLFPKRDLKGNGQQYLLFVKIVKKSVTRPKVLIAKVSFLLSYNYT